MIALLLLLGSLSIVSGAIADEPRPRLVVLALDAVPYEVVAELRARQTDDDPLLDGLRGPSALISTFPSTTTLAMSGILAPFGLERSPGYEARFFDRERNRIRGGGPISYRRIPFPWREIWDYKNHGIRNKAIGGLRPIRTSVRFLQDALEAFMGSDEPVFFAYTDATDLVGHLRGPDDLETVLRALDDILDGLRANRPGEPFYTVVFSDHGQHGEGILANTRKPIRRALKGSGFRVEKRIRNAADVVVVPFGLISSVTFYTRPEAEIEVAETVGRVDGVDLCVTRDGEEGAPLDYWHLLGSSGHALLERRTAGGDVFWRYRPLTGDPLGFAPLVETPSVERPASADAADAAWRSDRWWFEETKDGPYPDALYRVARAFDLVDNPASVICSLEDHAMYGSALTAFGARLTVKGGRLRHTHGALSREPSLGFVMSDLPGWNPSPILRFDQALEPFAAYADRVDDGDVAERVVTTPE